MRKRGHTVRYQDSWKASGTKVCFFFADKLQSRGVDKIELSVCYMRYFIAVNSITYYQAIKPTQKGRKKRKVFSFTCLLSRPGDDIIRVVLGD